MQATKLLSRIESGINGMLRPVAAWLHARDLKRAASYTERMAAPLMVATASIVPVALLLSAAALGSGAGIVAALTAATVMTAGAAVFAGAIIIGAFAAEDAISNHFGKKKTKTVVNLAGQTVTGTAYDIDRLGNYERRISFLRNALDGEQEGPAREALQKRLQDSFADAAPHAARVTVTADPAAAEGAPAAYAFAQIKTVATRV